MRERIERVAVTDFTILIEGGIGPQPHPNSIEVSDPPTLRGGNWEVAGAGEDGDLASPGSRADQRILRGETLFHVP